MANRLMQFLRAPGPEPVCGLPARPSILCRSAEEGYALEPRISIITLGVEDLERSCSFYDRLGWPRCMTQGEGIAFFRAGGLLLALYPRNELAKDANLADTARGFAGFTLAYNTRTREEVDSVLDEARTVGAQILKPAQEAFWGGYSGYFADPDGFAWEVAWNPFLTIAPNGSVIAPD